MMFLIIIGWTITAIIAVSWLGRLTVQQREQRDTWLQNMAAEKQMHANEVSAAITRFNDRLDSLTTSHQYYVLALKNEHAAALQQHSQDAVASSRRTMKGQAFEQFAIYCLPDINPADCRFLGSPIDYVIFRGSDGVRAGLSKSIDEIIFVEVKTGKARTSPVQKAVRDCIRAGHIRFITHNPETGKISDVKLDPPTELSPSIQSTTGNDDSSA